MPRLSPAVREAHTTNSGRVVAARQALEAAKADATTAELALNQAPESPAKSLRSKQSINSYIENSSIRPVHAAAFPKVEDFHCWSPAV